MEQYGGADGELAAALRYMNQRYTVPDKVIGVLNDIATEEFSHLEMLATMIYKLTKDATPEQLEEAGLGAHFVNHGHALFMKMLVVSRLPQRISRQRAIRSPICTKTSRRKKKHGRPINGLSTFPMIHLSTIPYDSCGSGKTSTPCASGKR